MRDSPFKVLMDGTYGCLWKTGGVCNGVCTLKENTICINNAKQLSNIQAFT